MSISNTQVVDFISTDQLGRIVLTITDDLIWDNDNFHILSLQNKINAYINFIASGDIYEKYPEAKSRQICIEVVSRYEPNSSGQMFLIKASEFLSNVGYILIFRVIPMN